MSEVNASSLSALAGSFRHDFDRAARAVLRFLQNSVGLGLWMVTRTRGDDWIVLQIEDRDYGIEANSVFRWADS